MTQSAVDERVDVDVDLEKEIPCILRPGWEKECTRPATHLAVINCTKCNRWTAATCKVHLMIVSSWNNPGLFRIDHVGCGGACTLVRVIRL